MKIKYLLPLLLFLFPLKVHAAEEVHIPGYIRTMSEQLGAQYDICPEVLQAMAWTESRCDIYVQNGSCKGMFQVNVYTWKDLIEGLEIEDYYLPYHNMMIACEVLKIYQGEDEELWNALYQYNGGSKYYANKILEISERLERQNGK